MSLASALALYVFGLISKEAPNVRTNEELAARYALDINELVQIHDQVADGRLINHDMDVLLLTAVNYRESRLRNPTEDGDCRFVHALQDLPSGSWPKGYTPVYKKRCNAVGPMQLAKGFAPNLSSWFEVASEFSTERGWLFDQPATLKQNPFKEVDLRDPRTNVRIAYAELAHWKQECRAKDRSEAPVGVWLTAYRYGHCPGLSKATGRFYIDREASVRCKLVQGMVAALTQDSEGLEAPRCVY